MKGAGTGGADIGANIVFRYDDGGTLGATRLWDPATGAFPCGATVSGINDRAGASCFDVHQRLHVGGGACKVP